MNVVPMKPPVENSVINALQDLLERAKAGDVTSLVYVTVEKGEYVVSRTTSLHDAVVMSSLMHSRFMAQFVV